MSRFIILKSVWVILLVIAAKIPSYPESVTIVNYTAYTISVAWHKPSIVPPSGLVAYVVRYQLTSQPLDQWQMVSRHILVNEISIELIPVCERRGVLGPDTAGATLKVKSSIHLTGPKIKNKNVKLITFFFNLIFF